MDEVFSQGKQLFGLAGWVEVRLAKLRVVALKRLQTETAVELNALLPSILDKAFRGGL